MNNPFDFFDKIFCLNLDRRPDRWEICIENFKKLGIEDKVTRIKAIDYLEHPHVPNEHKGKFGCVHSHLEMARYSKEQGYKNYLVLEDDFHIHAPVETINDTLSKCIEELPEDWDIFYPSANPLEHPKAIEDFSENLCKVLLTFSTHTVAINHTAYDDILAGANDNAQILNLLPAIVSKFINIDGYFMGVVLPKRMSYMAKKLMFTQRNSYSDVDLCSRDINNIIVEQYKKFDLLEI